MEAGREPLALAFLILLGLCGPAAADIVTFTDAQRGISFSYDDRFWKRIDSDRPDKLISIEVRLPEGQFVGLCRLKAVTTKFAASIEGRVHEERARITDRFTAGLRQRDPGAPAMESKPVMAGRQQMLELRLRNIDPYRTPGMTMILSLYTAYRGEEIMFECAYPDNVNRPDTEEPRIETEMRVLMKTLTFAD